MVLMKNISEIATKLQEYRYETDIFDNFVIGCGTLSDIYGITEGR